MRHRLGLTVPGASSPSMKAYSPRFHSTVPLARPHDALGHRRDQAALAASKSGVSANGSCAAIAAFAGPVADSQCARDIEMRGRDGNGGRGRQAF